ncbi:MAG: hypothetical protein II322_05010 [Alistipes sp.]|nr:hypothetical protein [Alistipes sp.]
MKIKNLFMMLLALMLVATACENTTDTPQTPDNTEEPETPNEDENKDDEGSKEDEDNKNEEDNSWIENPTPMPEATFVLNDGIAVSSIVTVADGMRNDYMTFYQESTGYAVYFDIYTADSNTMLPTGRYILSNEQMNTVYYEWSYFTPYTNSDLYRFTEGWLEVIADAEHSSGYPYHKIRGYFVMESEDSVSIEWEGTIADK